MAHELDSQGEWQRLVERYRAMSDGELLEMAAGLDNLTPVAAEVLRMELNERRLQVERAAAASFGSGVRMPESGGVGRGEVALMIFYDAMDAGRACDSLDERAVDFEMRDVSQAQARTRGYDSPPVALELIVKRGDRERVMAILRETMGLFPLQEVEEEDKPMDDGTMAVLGDFELREEADDVARVLEDAGIWHRVVANPEGTAEDENLYTLEVREIDLMRAGEVVEEALHLPED